jgi:hypothetical protein
MIFQSFRCKNIKNASIKNITSRLGAKLLLLHSSLNLDEQTRECQKLYLTTHLGAP